MIYMSWVDIADARMLRLKPYLTHVCYACPIFFQGSRATGTPAPALRPARSGSRPPADGDGGLPPSVGEGAGSHRGAGGGAMQQASDGGGPRGSLLNNPAEEDLEEEDGEQPGKVMFDSECYSALKFAYVSWTLNGELTGC